MTLEFITVDVTACRSEDKCGRKDNMCHGEPMFDDLSDVMFCNIHNNEVCLPQYDYSKCPATSSSEHQPSENMNNFKYNCCILQKLS